MKNKYSYESPRFSKLSEQRGMSNSNDRLTLLGGGGVTNAKSSN